MRIVTELADLPFAARRAVVINCGTKWVTTLALASLRAATSMPIVLIDCESRDGSRAHFEALEARHRFGFDWLEWPLRRHGVALDALFAGMPSDQVLLVDSDVEIRDRGVVEAMVERLERDPDAYGAGFLHGPEWMGADHGMPERVAWYAQRMWIPLVLLRTAPVREMLAHGVGFAQSRAFVEVAGWPRLSRLLAARFRMPGMRARATAQRPVPRIVEYDTGAAMHRALSARGHAFAELAPDRWSQVHHYHGVSRAGRWWSARKLAQRAGLVRGANDTAQSQILEDVRMRLQRDYAIHERMAD